MVRHIAMRDSSAEANPGNMDWARKSEAEDATAGVLAAQAPKMPHKKRDFRAVVPGHSTEGGCDFDESLGLATAGSFTPNELGNLPGAPNSGPKPESEPGAEPHRRH